MRKARAVQHRPFDVVSNQRSPGSVGRTALLTRTVVRLEGVVRGPVAPVAVIAPLDVRIASIDAVVLAIDDRACDQRSGGKGREREPVVAMAAIAGTIFA